MAINYKFPTGVSATGSAGNKDPRRGSGARGGVSMQGQNVAAQGSANYSEGDVNANVGASFAPGSQGSLGGSIIIGQGEGSQVGGQVGSLIGNYFFPVIGGLVGSAIGSTVGSVFNSGSRNKEHSQRNAFVSALMKAGMLTSEGTFTLPDGTVADFARSTGGDGARHGWKNSGAVAKEDRVNRDLFAFETDYTNDMDYAASMGGITLSRLLGGTKNTAIDQTGMLMGNQALGRVGYGAEFTKENFEAVMTNMGAMFSAAGIKSKADMLALSNKMLAEDRIDEADYAVAQQTAAMVFDRNYNLAQGLMSGRNGGINAAAQGGNEEEGKGGGAAESGPRTSGNPWDVDLSDHILSPEEVSNYIQPFINMRQRGAQERSVGQGRSRASGTMRDVGGVLSALAGLNKLTNGGIGRGIRGGWDDVLQTIGGGDSQWQLPEMNVLDMNQAGTASTSPGDYQLPDANIFDSAGTDAAISGSSTGAPDASSFDLGNMSIF